MVEEGTLRFFGKGYLSAEDTQRFREDCQKYEDIKKYIERIKLVEIFLLEKRLKEYYYTII